jgi:hypothetical protein
MQFDIPRLALVKELATLARERGCHGMWVATDTDNEAARATYARAGGKPSAGVLMLEWDFRSG